MLSRIVKQAKKDKEKISSLFCPGVSCIGKGKVGKQYEFGSKVALATLAVSQEMVGVERFTGNAHDNKTLAVSLDTLLRMPEKGFSRVLVDRGYRGHVKVGESEVILPDSCTGKRVYAVGQHKLGCRRRSGIEAVIGHLKWDHRLSRNYLKDRVGDRLNVLLAVIGFNFRLLLREIKFFVRIFYGVQC